MAEIIGNDQFDDYWSTTLGQICFVSAPSTSAGNLDSISVHIHTTTRTENCRLGIYANDNSGTLLLDAGEVAMTDGGVKTISGLTLALSASTQYWLCFCPNYAVSVKFLNNQGTNSTRYKSGSYGALPASLGARVDSYSGDTYKMKLYGSVTPSAGATNVVMNII